MELNEIEGIMHTSLDEKLEDLVGKVIQIEFSIHTMKKEHGGSGDWSVKKIKTEKETITTIVQGNYKGKIILISDFYLEAEKSTLKLKRKEEPMYHGYHEYQILKLVVID